MCGSDKQRSIGNENEYGVTIYEDKWTIPAMFNQSGNKDCQHYKCRGSRRIVQENICTNEPFRFFKD